MVGRRCVTPQKAGAANDGDGDPCIAAICDDLLLRGLTGLENIYPRGGRVAPYGCSIYPPEKHIVGAVSRPLVLEAWHA